MGHGDEVLLLKSPRRESVLAGRFWGLQLQQGKQRCCRSYLLRFNCRGIMVLRGWG